MINQLQHYPHRVLKAIQELGEATAVDVSRYMTQNGHRITPKRAARYLDELPGVTRFSAFRLKQGHNVPVWYEAA